MLLFLRWIHLEVLKNFFHFFLHFLFTFCNVKGNSYLSTKIKYVENTVWCVLFLLKLVVLIKFCHVVNMGKRAKNNLQCVMMIQFFKFIPTCCF